MKGCGGGEVPGPVYNDLLRIVVVHFLLLRIFVFLCLCQWKLFCILTLLLYRSKMSIIEMIEVNMIYRIKIKRH